MSHRSGNAAHIHAEQLHARCLLPLFQSTICISPDITCYSAADAWILSLLLARRTIVSQEMTLSPASCGITQLMAPNTPDARPYPFKSPPQGCKQAIWVPDRDVLCYDKVQCPSHQTDGIARQNLYGRVIP